MPRDSWKRANDRARFGPIGKPRPEGGLVATATLPEFIISLDAMQRRCGSLAPVLKAGGDWAVSEIKERFQNATSVTGAAWAPLKFPRVRGGSGPPLRDTGVLRASFTSTFDETTLTVGTAQPQAPLMQFGGIVRPKKGKFLAIPMTKQALRAGSPRNMQGLRFRMNPGGNSGAMMRGRTTQFLLVKKTTVPARPFMGFSDQWKADFADMAITFITTGRLIK
jgi:phage gpG-like protein